jgi:hypothetical protein
MNAALQRWHQMVEAGSLDALDDILAPDCVFLSPVVHTPQEGREITKLYLTGALNVLHNGFHYIKEVVTDKHAVLEFVCDVDGIVVNGVDIMTFNEDGQISEFKVMVRPVKALNMVHAKMKAMLEELSA